MIFYIYAIFCYSRMLFKSLRGHDLFVQSSELQAHARHMIDNKWVDVKRHDSDAHAAGPV